jgi:hypothetical protein
MATPTQGPLPVAPEAKVTVQINANPISANPDPFTVHVSKKEEVEWQCMQHHQHGNGKCFKIEFPAESPFAGKIFHDHGAKSGLPVVQPGDKLYKYNVTIPGVGTLDPQGGVKG